MTFPVWLAALIALGGLSGIASLVGAIVIVYKARPDAQKIIAERKKAETEAYLVEAETAEKYQQIADRAADRALKMDERVKTLEETVKCLDETVTRQETMISILKSENSCLRADVDEFDRVLIGAHVLHDQVRELNATPLYVPPERRLSKGIL